MNSESGNGISTVTWLGHGSVLLTSPRGSTLLIDPWLRENPSTPETLREIDHVDTIAITHGHFDHIGDVRDIAARTGALVIATSEMAAFFGADGVANVHEMNKGGTVQVRDMQVTMVGADHSSGISIGDGKANVEGGAAVGFVVRAPGMSAVYVSGDTGVFGDMELIADLYSPDLALLPIDGNFNMGPYEAAHACRLLRIARVIPYHWGTFPVLRGEPADFRQELNSLGIACEVLTLDPGQSVSVDSAPRAS